jgi:hypothetical protein
VQYCQLYCPYKSLCKPGFNLPATFFSHRLVFHKTIYFKFQELKSQVQSDLDDSMVFESRLQAALLTDQ